MMPLCSCRKFPRVHSEIPPRVLVLDDESLVRWSLTMGLRRAGFAADSAADPAEALQLAAQRPSPDVVLLDAALWGADPFVLFEEIRALAPRCRFLILAVAGQELRLPPWDDVGVIRKPFDLSDVVRVVQETVPCAGHSDRLAV